MDSAPAADEAALFRRRTRRYLLAANLVLGAILAVVALTVFVVVFRGQGMTPRALGQLALSWAPALFYLWALWSLRALFVAFAREGMAFRPPVTRMLARVGWALMLGSVTTVIVSPLALKMIRPHGRGSFAAFDVPAMTLGVVGLALIALASMLRRGVRLEAETLALKADLDDFI